MQGITLLFLPFATFHFLPCTPLCLHHILHLSIYPSISISFHPSILSSPSFLPSFLHFLSFHPYFLPFHFIFHSHLLSLPSPTVTISPTSSIPSSSLSLSFTFHPPFLPSLTPPHPSSSYLYHLLTMAFTFPSPYSS